MWPTPRKVLRGTGIKRVLLSLIQQMDEKLQFPGLTNTWTMPVENRLDMELTGV
jgi:Cu/Ag efflux pump CusA